METFDAIVIGSGQGGMPLAQALASAGRRTAVIERAAVGGSCINYGCTPTKTLVHIAKVAETVRRSSEYGVRSSQPLIDMLKARELKRAIVEEFRSGSEKSLVSTPGLELIYGDATFVGHRRIQIASRDGGVRTATAREIFINTGTSAFVPPLPGLDSIWYLDNVSVMELDRVPASLIVLGGGYIGLEFGQMIARLGSKVTVLENGDRFLPHEDRDVSEEVLKILTGEGLDIRVGESAKSVLAQGSRVVLETQKERFEAEELLVAVGRTPNTRDLGLAEAGIETDDKGYIQADSHLRTTADGVYVIGDVKGGPAFTHISYDDYRILKANLLDGEHRTTDGRMLPYVVFIDPELARIGMSEDEAKRSGIPYRLYQMPMSDVARAEEMNETRGFMKALVDEVSGRILGATVLGVSGGEVMSMIELAMLGGLTAKDLNNAIFAHPTLSESLNNLFAS